MSLSSTLDHARKRFEADGMLSTVRIERPTGERTLNHATGRMDQGDRVVVYAGKCSLSGQGRQRIPDTAERELIQGRYDLALPWSSEAAHDVQITDVAIVNGKSFDVESVDMADDRKAKYLTVVAQSYG